MLKSSSLIMALVALSLNASTALAQQEDHLMATGVHRGDDGVCAEIVIEKPSETTAECLYGKGFSPVDPESLGDKAKEYPKGTIFVRKMTDASVKDATRAIFATTSACIGK